MSGILGPASSLEKKTTSVAETSIGMGGTASWRLASLDASTTLAVFFEIGGPVRGTGTTDPSQQAQQQFFLQFITKYLHESGEFRCRVTTFTRG